MQFVKANKKSSKLRMALSGISNSGKTWTSLAIATGLGGPIALIDTERGSASKYADYFNFDVLELEQFHPEKYVEAIETAGDNGYAVCVIDSLSHAWIGEDGALDLVQKATRGSDSANSYFAWREITPLQNQLIEAILRSPCHVLATLRSKAEYTIEKDHRGKSVPKKIGLAPIQRQGLEYEFDLFGTMDDEHVLEITKSRFPRLAGSIKKPGLEFGKLLAQELSGEAPAVSLTASAANAADDLYGDGAGDRMRNGHRQATQVVPGDDIPEKQHGGALYLDQIDAAWRAGGLSAEQIASYWVKTCRFYEVENRTEIKGSLLPKLLGKVREWLERNRPVEAITKSSVMPPRPAPTPEPEMEDIEITPEPMNTMGSPWRLALTAACKGVQDEETLDAVGDVGIDPHTPDAVGEALLERVKVVAAEAGARVQGEV